MPVIVMTTKVSEEEAALWSKAATHDNKNGNGSRNSWIRDLCNKQTGKVMNTNRESFNKADREALAAIKEARELIARANAEIERMGK